MAQQIRRKSIDDFGVPVQVEQPKQATQPTTRITNPLFELNRLSPSEEKRRDEVLSKLFKLPEEVIVKDPNNTEPGATQAELDAYKASMARNPLYGIMNKSDKELDSLFSFKNPSLFTDKDEEYKQGELEAGLTTNRLKVEKVNDEQLIFNITKNGERGNLPLGKITRDGRIERIRYAEPIRVGGFGPNIEIPGTRNELQPDWLTAINEDSEAYSNWSRVAKDPLGISNLANTFRNLFSDQDTYFPAEYYAPPSQTSEGTRDFSLYAPRLTQDLLGGIALGGGAAVGGAPAVVAGVTSSIPSMVRESESTDKGYKSLPSTITTTAAQGIFGGTGGAAGGQLFKEGAKQAGKIIGVTSAIDGATALAENMMTQANREANEGKTDKDSWTDYLNAESMTNAALQGGLSGAVNTITGGGVGYLANKIKGGITTPDVNVTASRINEGVSKGLNPDEMKVATDAITGGPTVIVQPTGFDPGDFVDDAISADDWTGKLVQDADKYLSVLSNKTKEDVIKRVTGVSKVTDDHKAVFEYLGTPRVDITTNDYVNKAADVAREIKEASNGRQFKTSGEALGWAAKTLAGEEPSRVTGTDAIVKPAVTLTDKIKKAQQTYTLIEDTLAELEGRLVSLGMPEDKAKQAVRESAVGATNSTTYNQAITALYQSKDIKGSEFPNIIKQKVTDKISKKIAEFNPEFAEQFKTAKAPKNTKKLKDNPNTPTAPASNVEVIGSVDNIVKATQKVADAVQAGDTKLAVQIAETSGLTRPGEAEAYVAQVIEQTANPVTVDQTTGQVVINADDINAAKIDEIVDAIENQTALSEVKPRQKVKYRNDAIWNADPRFAQDVVHNEEDGWGNYLLTKAVLLIGISEDEAQKAAIKSDIAEQLGYTEQYIDDLASKVTADLNAGLNPDVTPYLTPPKAFVINIANPQELDQLVRAKTVTNTSSPGIDTVSNPTTADKIQTALTTNPDGDRIDGAMRELKNGVLAPYESTTPIIKLSTGHTVRIAVPESDLELKTLLNYNPDNLTEEEKSLVREAFSDMYGYDIDSASKDITDYINAQADQDVSDALAGGMVLDRITLSDDTKSFIDEYLGMLEREPQVAKTGYDAELNKAAEGEVLHNVTMQNGLTLATMPIFGIPIDDTDEAEEAWYDKLIKGTGYVAAMGIIGMQSGKYNAAKKKALDWLKGTRLGKSIISDTRKTGVSIEDAINSSPYMKAYQRTTADELAAGIIKTKQDADNAIIKERQKLIQRAKKLANKPIGNVPQKAQQSDEWKTIYERMTSGRIEALADVAPAAEKFKDWVKTTSPELQEVLIKGNIRFRRDYVDWKNMGATEEQLDNAARNFISSYIAPNLPEGVSIQSATQAFNDFRNILDALTQADMTIAINNDLVWFQNNFAKYVPGMSANERITLERLIANEQHFIAERDKIKDNINFYKESIEDNKVNKQYYEEETAKAEVAGDTEKQSKMQTEADRCDLRVKALEKSLKLEEGKTELKAYTLLAKEAKEAKRFYKESASHLYIDPMAAQRYEAKDAPIAQVLKAELIDPETGVKITTLKNGTEYKDAFAPIKSHKRFFNDDQKNAYNEEYFAKKNIVKDAVTGNYYHTDAEGNTFLIRPIVFNPLENRKVRATQKQQIIDTIQALTVAGKTGAFEYSPPELKKKLKDAKEFIRKGREALEAASEAGDDEATELLQYNDEIEQFIDFAINDTSPTALDQNIQRLFEKIVGGRGLKKHQAKNFDGYEADANGNTYTHKEYIEAYGEKFGMHISQAETQAGLSAANNMIGDMRYKGLVDNNVYNDIVEWRDQTMLESPEANWLAQVWNTSGYLKGVAMIAGRPSTAVKNFFANINQIMLNRYINGQSVNLPMVLFEYGKAMRNATDRKYMWQGMLGKNELYHNLDKSKALHDLIIRGYEGVDRVAQNPKIAKDITEFKQKIKERLSETGAYSESAMNELAITTGNKFMQGVDRVVKWANTLNKGADALGRAVVVNKAIDDYLADMTQKQDETLKALLSGNIDKVDPAKYQKLIDEAVLKAHMNADATLGRFSPLYKSKLERMMLTKYSFAPGLMVYTGPAMVGLHNWINWFRAVAPKNKRVAEGLGVMSLAIVMGGTAAMPALNDLLTAGSFLSNINETDQDALTNEQLDLSYFNEIENDFRVHLMENLGFSADGADKVIIGAKRGGLSGFTNRAFAQEESFLNIFSPVMVETYLQTAEAFKKDGFGWSPVDKFFTAGILKELWVGSKDLIRGYRTDKNDFATGHEYGAWDFIADMFLAKPLTLSGARQEKFLSKSSLFGSDNRREFSKAFFANSGIKFQGLDTDAKGIKSDPIFDQAAPYLASQFVARMADPDVSNAMENANEFIDSAFNAGLIFGDAKVVDEMAFLCGFSDLPGDAKSTAMTELKSRVKQAATKNFMSEVTGRTFDDFKKTKEGQQLLKRYNVITPVKTNIQRQAMSAHSLTGKYIEFNPYGNDNVSAMYDYGKIALVHTLYTKFVNSTTPKTAENYERLKRLATQLMTRKDE